MSHKAVMFGAIGTLVETSDLQRRAFNQAFVDAGVDWFWTPETYRGLLVQSGGVARIERFAAELGETVDAKALHATKVRLFASAMAREGLTLRAGVRDVIDAAKRDGMKVAFVTSTGKDQSDAIFDALGDDLTKDEFDYIGDSSRVSSPKPAPDIYLDALQSLGLSAKDALAIEDTPVSADAAIAAGIETLAFPGAMANATQFAPGVQIVEMLTPNILEASLMAAE